MKPAMILLGVALLAVVIWRLLGVEISTLAADEISPGDDIVFFSAPWCGYCDQARIWFDALDTDYREIDIEASTANHRLFQEVNGRGVPLVFIGDQRLAGFSAAAYQRAFKRLPGDP